MLTFAEIFIILLVAIIVLPPRDLIKWTIYTQSVIEKFVNKIKIQTNKIFNKKW